MNLSVDELNAIAAEWRAARCIHSVYLGIAERFELRVPPCADLDQPLDLADPAALARIRAWLEQTDQRIQVHQLRVFLQTSPLATEEVLLELGRHYLSKGEACGDSERDKLDFLLVQYFSQCAPSDLKYPAIDDVARVLRPLLGDGPLDLSVWEGALDDVLQRMGGCCGMQDLLQTGILREVREIKTSAGREYFSRPALIVFTRFNYLLRQMFFHLMRADIEAIKQGLRGLAGLGVTSVDCARANLSNAEPLARVLKLCQQWRKPFQEEYSAGNPFAQIAELRAAVEETLRVSRKPVETEQVQAGAPPQSSPPKDITENPELEKLLARLPSYLNADPRSRQSGATIVSGKSRVVLSPAEVRAFVDGDGTTQGMVRRAVACRLLLFQSMEQVKSGGSPERLSSAVALVAAEAEWLSSVIAESRAQGRASATLCAATKRLKDMLEKSGEFAAR